MRMSIEIPMDRIRWSKVQEKQMNKLRFTLLRVIQDERGQDMVEYALLAGFIAVAAGALLPPISDSISVIFSRMGSVVAAAAS